MIELLLKGGPILMLIAALSVISLAVILWKISQLLRLGALRSGQTTDAATSQWCAGEDVSAVLAARSWMRASFGESASTIPVRLPPPTSKPLYW